MFLLVPAYPGSPGQKAVKRLCVCVCKIFSGVAFSRLLIDINYHLSFIFDFYLPTHPIDQRHCFGLSVRPCVHVYRCHAWQVEAFSLQLVLTVDF